MSLWFSLSVQTLELSEHAFVCGLHRHELDLHGRNARAEGRGSRATMSYACRAHSHSNGRVSRGSMISSIPKCSAVRNGERTASKRLEISLRSVSGSSDSASIAL